MVREFLTHERMRGLYKNNFELCNRTIALGHYYIKSGHEIIVDDLLEQIRLHPGQDLVKELQAVDAAQDDEEVEEEKG